MKKLCRSPFSALLGIAVAVSLLAAGPKGWGHAPAEQATTSTATDAAYAAGYNAGFPLGQQDQGAAVAANAHKFRLYQDGTAGYTESYGTREAYRSSFQSGFDDGYADGYAQRPRSVGGEPAVPAAVPDKAPAAADGGPPAPQAPPAAAAPHLGAPSAAGPALDAGDAIKTARGNGYRMGYDQGQVDADHNAAYNQTASAEYQQATSGYHQDLGDAEQYQLNFRSGYTAGYDDGYHHRLYNTAIGPPPPAEASATGELPTDPAKLRMLPSGVYNNGLLIAGGTHVHVMLDSTLDTKTAHVGDRFHVTVTVPIWVGAVAAIPAGSTIQGAVEQSSRGGALSGTGQLQLQYNTVTLPGQTPVGLNAITSGVGAGTQSVNQGEGTVDGQSPNTGEHAATGAAMGGIFGGVFGGVGGLIRGGIAGAAAGTAGVLVSHKKDLVLHQGERLTLQLEQPLVLPKSGE